MKYHKRGEGGDVVPLRPSVPVDPTSVTVRVARKVSGTGDMSPLEVSIKLIEDLTAAALAGYSAARQAWTDDDGDQAILLVQRAAKALEMASEIAAELAAR